MTSRYQRRQNRKISLRVRDKKKITPFLNVILVQSKVYNLWNKQYDY
jgi:hypothetical protein